MAWVLYVSDDFNRSNRTLEDDSLPAPYAAWDYKKAPQNGGATTARVVTNQVDGTAAGGSFGLFKGGVEESFTNVRMVVDEWPGGKMLRLSARATIGGGGHRYCLNVDSNTQMRIFVDNVTKATQGGLSISNGDTIMFEVEGKWLKGYQNGTLRISYEDTTLNLVSGGIGIWMEGSSPNIDNFKVYVPDTTAPTVSSATINSAGNVLTVVMSENVTGTPTGFSLTADGNAVALSGGAISGDTITYDLDATVYFGQTCLLSYAGSDIEDGSGNALVAFSDGSVTNNSTQASSTVRGRGRRFPRISVGLRFRTR